MSPMGSVSRIELTRSNRELRGNFERGGLASEVWWTTFGRLLAGDALAICSAVVVACSASGSLRTSPRATASVPTSVSSGSTSGVLADRTETSGSGTSTDVTSEATSVDTGDSYLDDPTKFWDGNKAHLPSVAEATTRLRSVKGRENVTAAEGK